MNIVGRLEEPFRKEVTLEINLKGQVEFSVLELGSQQTPAVAWDKR